MIGFRQHRQIDTKTVLGILSTGNRLEYQIYRYTPVERIDLIGHMGEHAGLRGNGVMADDIIQHF